MIISRILRYPLRFPKNGSDWNGNNGQRIRVKNLAGDAGRPIFTAMGMSGSGSDGVSENIDGESMGTGNTATVHSACRIPSREEWFPHPSLGCAHGHVRFAHTWIFLFGFFRSMGFS
jgi:hypothetical protein